LEKVQDCSMSFLEGICSCKSPQLAVLIDPGKSGPEHWKILLQQSVLPHFFMVGGSTGGQKETEFCTSFLKDNQSKPVVLFPGNETQITSHADAIFLLSLLSGRNPDLLIGKHIRAAEQLDALGIEIIPTAYLLVENGGSSSVQQVSQTTPIGRNDNKLALQTALAGQQLGMKLIYLEAGSGAPLPVPVPMIQNVKLRLRVPLIVGGGISSGKQCSEALAAGADIVVVGNALEKNPELLPALVNTVSRHEN
jgi:putative glycerol-1-phosphate prenyltransferase